MILLDSTQQMRAGYALIIILSIPLIILGLILFKKIVEDIKHKNGRLPELSKPIAKNELIDKSKDFFEDIDSIKKTKGESSSDKLLRELQEEEEKEGREGLLGKILGR